jgi:hypothetical protein
MTRIKGPGWPDQRGWMAIGLFGLTAWVLWLARPIHGAPPSEFFKVLAQAVVITGFINSVVGFLYTSSKGAAEAREQTGKALDIAHAATRPADPAINP